MQRKRRLMYGIGAVIIIGFVIVCIYKVTHNIGENENENVLNQIENLQYETIIPSVLLNKSFMQNEGKGILFSDSQGRNLNSTETIQIEGDYLEGFLTLVNATDEEGKDGIAWESNGRNMLHRKIELELPKQTGIYELYILALPISTNHFTDTFSSEKIALVLK